MNTRFLLASLCLFWLPFKGISQGDKAKDYRNFPIVITIQFQAFAMPFKDFKSNFKNVGIGIGTEVSHSSYHDWVQKFDITWFRNKAMGSGLLFSSQVAWRPYLVSNSFTEIKAGVGYHIAFRPTESFIQKDGSWKPVQKQGKGMLAIPVGISIGYHNYQNGTFVSPFVGYQVMFLKNYNKSIPIVPMTFVQTGARIHPVYPDIIQD